MAIELREHQLKAIESMGSGKILYGGVGSGKSAAVLGYYVKAQSPRDIVVITTARKRDSLDWEAEAAKFGIGAHRDATLHGTILVDSWNNIAKYEHLTDCFFIFDEQRVVGTGHWSVNFIKIAKKNQWILLSATPGDTWLDYAPVFIANGFYKNITDFKFKHVLYEAYSKYPKVRGYLDVRRLEILRNDILVEMPYARETTRIIQEINVGYDVALVKKVWTDRWNIFTDEPCKDIAEVFRVMRRIVNSDEARLDWTLFLMRVHPKLIVFYNFDYELELLRTLVTDAPVYEWNGHQKDPIPESDKWVYLVQYVAGAEAWNCTETDAMVFWSRTYSFKNDEQAMGRIDRMDTPFKLLYYYKYSSNSIVDRGIKRSLDRKESFNERRYVAELEKFGEVALAVEEAQDGIRQI